MSPEISNNPDYEAADKNHLIRDAVRLEFQLRGVSLPNTLETLLDHAEVLDIVLTSVKQRMADQGYEIETFDLLDALLVDDEGDQDNPTNPEPDTNPDEDKGGGSRVPRVRKRPPDNSSGAEVTPELENDPEDSKDKVEHYFPTPDSSDPLHQIPRIPVGFILK